MAERDEDQTVKGLELHSEPVADKHNKFVIIENRAWFLPFEDNGSAPTLGEILASVVDLSDPDIEETYDQKIEDGLIVMGYVDRDSRVVSVHLPDSPTDKRLETRLDEVFGKGTTYD